jgi:hypothetical protein
VQRIGRSHAAPDLVQQIDIACFFVCALELVHSGFTP